MIIVHKKVRGTYETSPHESIETALAECMNDLTHKTSSPQSIEQKGKVLFDQEELFSLWIDAHGNAA